MKYADLAQEIDFLSFFTLKSEGSSSKPIILGEPSVIGEFADSFSFQIDPPDFNVIQVLKLGFLEEIT